MQSLTSDHAVDAGMASPAPLRARAPAHSASGTGTSHIARLPWGVLALTSLAALGMLAFRAYFTGQGAYFFLAYNLLLAWIPLALAVSGAHLLANRRRFSISIVVPAL